MDERVEVVDVEPGVEALLLADAVAAIEGALEAPSIPVEPAR
ncbi:hypothetical protein [Streptomyces sp. AP-93]|nr:hypothetical protein [Streptomyces sp. AP-93]